MASLKAFWFDSALFHGDQLRKARVMGFSWNPEAVLEGLSRIKYGLRWPYGERRFFEMRRQGKYPTQKRYNNLDSTQCLLMNTEQKFKTEIQRFLTQPGIEGYQFYHLTAILKAGEIATTLQQLAVPKVFTNNGFNKEIEIVKATECRIESQNEAASLDKLLDQYLLEHDIDQGTLMKLGDAYNALKRNGRDQRCFSAYLDLYLQDIALQEDVVIIRREINREYQSGKVEGFFAERMGRYIAASNVAHRVRAMWDKLMGLTVLLNWSDKYNNFCSSKSRLSAYKKIAESWRIPDKTLLTADSEQLKEYKQWNSDWAEEISKITRCVDFISNNYRTAEAHFVGRIWKWAFEIQRDEEDPFIELLNSTNDLRDRFQQISALIRLSHAHRQHVGEHCTTNLLPGET